MRVLGLDISTVATGWAIIEDGKLLKYGVICPDDELNDCEKNYYITQSVATVLKLYKPNDLAIEDTFMGKNVVTLKKLSRIAGQIMYLWYHATRMEPIFYMASTARTSIPGLKGTAEKSEVTDAVNTFFKLRKKIEDHNIADAVVTAFHHWNLKNDKGILNAKKACKKRGRKKSSNTENSNSQA